MTGLIAELMLRWACLYSFRVYAHKFYLKPLEGGIEGMIVRKRFTDKAHLN